MTGIALYPDKPLGEPVRKFADTFSGEEVILTTLRTAAEIEAERKRSKRDRSTAYHEATTLATLLNSGADLDDVLAQWSKVNKSLSDLIGGG